LIIDSLDLLFSSMLIAPRRALVHLHAAMADIANQLMLKMLRRVAASAIAAAADAAADIFRFFTLSSPPRRRDASSTPR